MKRVEVKSGVFKTFPDDATDEEIEEIINSEYPLEQKKQGQKDLLQQLFESPGEIGEAFKSIIPSTIEAGKMIAKHPIQSAEDVLGGLLKGTRGQIDLVIPKEKQPTEGFLGEIFQPSEFTQSIYKRPEAGHQVLQSIGSYLPAMVGKYALAPFKAALLARGMGENPFTAGAMFALPKIAEKGISKAAQFLEEPKLPDFSPSGIAAKIGRSDIPSEKLESNIRASEEANVPLGRILESPALNTLFEAYSSVFPFAGGTKYLGKLKDQVYKAGEETLESLKPQNISGDLNFAIKDLLVDAFQKQLEQKNKLYNNRNSIAESENFKLNLPEFEKNAKEIHDILKDSALYKSDSEFRNSFNKLLGYENIIEHKPEVKSKILDAYGNPIVLEKQKKIMPSLTDAQTTANKLERIGSSYLSSSDADARFIGGKYKDVANALRSDIKNSIQKNGSENLKNAQKQADKTFAEKFVPFLDDHIYDILQKDYDPQSLIQEIIKPSKSHDKFTDIKKVLNLLPEEKRNVLGYSYLKNKSVNKKGEFLPQEFDKALKSLGNRQFETLFSENDRLKLSDFQTLKNMSGRALDVMNIPKTGFGAKELGFITALTTAIVKDPSLMTALGLTSPILPAKYLNRVLTDQNFRTKVLDKIKEKQQSKPKVETLPLLKYFTPALKVPTNNSINDDRSNSPE